MSMQSLHRQDRISESLLHSQVSRTAKMMITQGGFSKKLGQVAWTSGQQNTFVGQQMGQPSDCSGETNDEIDQEVKSLVDRAYR